MGLGPRQLSVRESYDQGDTCMRTHVRAHAYAHSLTHTALHTHAHTLPYTLSHTHSTGRVLAIVDETVWNLHGEKLRTWAKSLDMVLDAVIAPGNEGVCVCVSVCG